MLVNAPGVATFENGSAKIECYKKDHNGIHFEHT